MRPRTSASPAEPAAAAGTKPLQAGLHFGPGGRVLRRPLATVAATSARSWPGPGKGTVLTTATSGRTALPGTRIYVKLTVVRKLALENLLCILVRKHISWAPTRGSVRFPCPLPAGAQRASRPPAPRLHLRVSGHQPPHHPERRPCPLLASPGLRQLEQDEKQWPPRPRETWEGSFRGEGPRLSRGRQGGMALHGGLGRRGLPPPQPRAHFPA